MTDTLPLFDGLGQTTAGRGGSSRILDRHDIDQVGAAFLTDAKVSSKELALTVVQNGEHQFAARSQPYSLIDHGQRRRRSERGQPRHRARPVGARGANP